MRKKKITILGSTGSIGRNALRVISALSDIFQVKGLSAQSNASLLAEQANKFRLKTIAIGDETKVGELKKKTKGNVSILAGKQGIERLAKEEADVVLIAISGSASIRAITLGHQVANCLGSWLSPTVRMT